MGLCKSYSKKEGKKRWEKMDKCPRYLKQWVLRCPPEKKEKEMNKIVHVLLQTFSSFKREICFQGESRIRLATIYPHTCTFLFDCMTQLSLDPRFDFTIYVLQVCSSFLPTYELHISLSSRKRKGITSLLPWWGSTNITYIERLESVIQRKLWVLFLKSIKTLE